MNDSERTVSQRESTLPWVPSHNVDELIASDDEHLQRIVDIPRSEYQTTGRVPGWAGAHLLRAWLLLLHRRYPRIDEGSALRRERDAVVEALAERGQVAPDGHGNPTAEAARSDGRPRHAALVSAVEALSTFLSGTPLTERIRELEHELVDRSTSDIVRGVGGPAFGADVLNAALTVRRELGRHDDIIHAAVILAVLPSVMDKPGEKVIVQPSLGAGNDPSVQHFDLETTHRCAEFKVSFWKRADSARKRATFADLAKLVLNGDPQRHRQLFVVGDAPIRFLRHTTSDAAWGLAKTSAAFREQFAASFPLTMTISAFTAGPGANVEIVDLCEQLPQLRAMDFPTEPT